MFIIDGYDSKKQTLVVPGLLVCFSYIATIFLTFDSGR